MPLSPLAGRPAPKELLVDPARLESEYESRVPDPGQPAQRGVHLAEGQRLAPTEIRVIIAFKVISMAGLAFEQAKQCQGYAHPVTIH